MKNISEGKAIEILMADSSIKDRQEKDFVFEGMKILSKYTKRIIGAAEHDQIYGPDLDELLEGGITIKELESLRDYGWGYDRNGNCLYHFI